MQQKINSVIIEKLTEVNLENIDLGIMYLLGLFYDLDTSCISEEVQRLVHLSKIVERDYNSNEKVKWNVSLFETSEETDENWKWVEEYRKLFSNIKSDKRGDKKGTISKMKKFFAENPEVRVDDVFQATKMYLEKFRNAPNEAIYMTQADYFISKVEKGDKKSKLLMYIEILKENQIKSSSSSNKVVR